MKRSLCILLLMSVILSRGLAQNAKEYFKIPYAPSPSQPYWVQLMYGPDPNIYEVTRQYETYYQTHNFEKNIHTQNYKFWNKQIAAYINEDGFIRPYETAAAAAGSANMRLSSASSSASILWQPIGPFETFSKTSNDLISNQANIYDFSIAKSNKNIMIAGVEGGLLYKSVDAAKNWNMVQWTIDNGISGVSSCHIDPNNETIMYFNDGNKLYKSTDGANTFTLLSSTFTSNVTSVKPGNSNIIFVAATQGLFKSTDGGMTWAQVGPTGECYDIEFNPLKPDTMFALIENAENNITYFYKSTDGGETWTIKTSGYYNSTDVNRTSMGGKIGITAADTSRIYVALIGYAKSGDNGWIGVFRSNNSGESWFNPVGQTGGPYAAINSTSPWNIAAYSSGYHQGFYNFDLAVSDSNPDLFWIGTIRLTESSDGGYTYTAIGGANSSRLPKLHADIQRILINGNDCFVATDGGIDYSADEFQSITSVKKGINGSTFWGYDNGWNEDVVVGGRYHNGNGGIYQTYGSGNSLFLGGGESATGYVDPLDSREVKFSDVNDLRLPETLNGVVSTISSFALYPNESYTENSSSNVLYDVTYRNHIYLGNQNVIYKSEDNGHTFTNKATFPNSRVLKIHQSRANPEALFAVVYNNSLSNAKRAELWRSLDHGEHWKKLTIDVLLSRANLNVAVSQQQAGKLWIIGTGNSSVNKVFYSTDYGNTWKNISGSLPAIYTVYDALAQPTDFGDMLYLGCRDAVIRYNELTSSWENMSTGLPKKFTGTIIKPFYRDNKIRAAIRSVGIWEATLPEETKIIPQPFTTTPVIYCARDTVVLDSYSLVNVENATFGWSFNKPPAYVSSLNERRIKVVFGTAGIFDITLTILKDGQSYAKTVDNMISIKDLCNTDTDGDGIVDSEDDDIDGDGLLNVVENYFKFGNISDIDGDNDENLFDVDSDNDGIADANEIRSCVGQTPRSTSTISGGNEYIIHTFAQTQGTILINTKSFVNCYGMTNELYLLVDLTNQKLTPVAYSHFNQSDFSAIMINSAPNLVYSQSTSFGSTGWRLDGQNLYYQLISQACGSTGRTTSFCILAEDLNANGIIDVYDSDNLDLDHDGVVNALDSDDDNDGISDIHENSVCVPESITCDTDGDGRLNMFDLDSDNDGINDILEAGNEMVIDADTDFNGTLSESESPAGIDGTPLAAQKNTDGTLAMFPADTDLDGIPNAYDLDSDGDGINDIDESLMNLDNDTNGLIEGTDEDADGILSNADSDLILFGDPNPANISDADVWNGVVITGNDADFDGIIDAFDGLPNTFGDSVSPKVTVKVKAFLQGALFGVNDNLMKDSLRTKGFIPLNSPFPDLGFTSLTHTPATTKAALAVSGQNAIVDWVFLELRSATDSTVVLDSRSALIQCDGDVVDTDGISAVAFTIAEGSYYVALRHRNHLGIMTEAPLALTILPVTIDFTSPNTPVYKSNTNAFISPQIRIGDKMALWSTNSLLDQSVIFQGNSNDTDMIYNEIVNDAGNIFKLPSYTTKKYSTSDFILQGFTKFQGNSNSVEYIYNNVIGHPGNTFKLPFFIIKEQLPR